MKIAYITDQILPRRAADTFQLVSMVSALGRTGAEVTIVTPSRRDGQNASPDDVAAFFHVEATFDVEPVRSAYPLFRGFEKVAHSVAARKASAVASADLLYTRNLPVVISALLGSDMPVVYETYRPWPHWNRYGKPFFDWVGGRKNFLGAVLHSDLARKSYEGTRIPASKLLTAHNGIDLSLFDPPRSKNDVRKVLGIRQSVPVVTYAGSVSVAKGLDEVLEMARRLPEVTFLLVGSEGRGAIEQAAEEIPNVLIVPWRPLKDAVPYLLAADVLIIPPSSRPLRQIGNTVLPIKTFLYLAAGRTILAPSTPDVTEVLRDDENAVLVEPDDAARAAIRLRDLLARPDTMERLGRAAARQSLECTWDRRAEKVLAFLGERLRHHAGAGKPLQSASAEGNEPLVKTER